MKAMLVGRPGRADSLRIVTEGDDEIHFVHFYFIDTFCDVIRNIDILFGHHLHSAWINRRRRPDAGTQDFNPPHPVVACQSLGHWTPADIAGADKKDAVRSSSV